MRARFLLLILAVLLGSCTLFGGADEGSGLENTSTVPPEIGGGFTSPGDSSPDTSPDDTLPDVDPRPSPEPADGELFELLSPEDRIVVQNLRQDLSILTFAGEQPVPTANDATQPVFSPDGSRLAWTAFTPDVGTATLVLGSVGGDGAVTIDAEIVTPVISFYTVWAPGSNDTLAVLGNGGVGVGVGVVDEQGSTVILDSDVPYYFSWTDAADAFVAHAGGSLRSFDLGADEGTDLIDVSGSFQTPVLLDGGDAVVAIDKPVGGGAASALVRISPAAVGADGGVDPETLESLAQYDGRASLFLSPDRERLAVLIEGSGGLAQVLNDSTTTSQGGNIAIQNVRILTRGLHVIELGTGEITTLRSDNARAAFWAPDSSLIASLAFDSLGNGRPYSSWAVHDAEGNEISVSPRFVISGTFEGGYLPFIDQYAQAVTIWSPDSTRFVFPGRSVAGEEGIWLHRLPGPAGDAATFRIGEGVVAFWSPAVDPAAPVAVE